MKNGFVCSYHKKQRFRLHYEANSDRDTIFSWFIEHGYADEELETCTKLELLARLRKVHVVAKYEVFIFNANFYFLGLFYGIHILIGEYNYV